MPENTRDPSDRMRAMTRLVRGKVEDQVEVPGGGRVLSLTDAEGLPEAEMVLRTESGRCRVVEVGRTSTDGQAVSTGSCLTARQIAPHGVVAVECLDGDPPRTLYGTWVVEEQT